MRKLSFFLTEDDERRIKELTLAGVIDSKIAKGDYEEDEVEDILPSEKKDQK